MNSESRSFLALAWRLLLPVRVLLMPVYWLGYWGHRLLYLLKLKPTHRLPAPVICVGNLTVGGSGKTPVVIALARLLDEMGRRVGVLSRGYLRERPCAEPVVVSDGEKICAGLEEAGDEATLIALQAPRAVVVVCPKRAVGGALALEQYGCDVLLLDDGFQHWALERDVNVVCVDAALPLERARLLPWGIYRELVSALRRASAVAFTQQDDPAAVERQERHLKDRGFLPRLPVWRAHAKPNGYVKFGDDEELLAPTLLAGRRVVAACAIARPAYFEETLCNVGAAPVAFFALSDHDSYDDAAIGRIEDAARECAAELILVTAKDYVKLRGRVNGALPWHYLNVEVDWPEPRREAIRFFLHTALARADGARR